MLIKKHIIMHHTPPYKTNKYIMNTLLITVFILCVLVTQIDGITTRSVYTLSAMTPEAFTVPICPIVDVANCIVNITAIIPTNSSTTNKDTQCGALRITTASINTVIVMTLVALNDTIPDRYVVGYSPLVLCFPYEYYVVFPLDSPIVATSHPVTIDYSIEYSNVTLGSTARISPRANRTTLIITNGCVVDSNAVGAMLYEEDYLPLASFHYSPSDIEVSYNLIDSRLRMRYGPNNGMCLMNVYFLPMFYVNNSDKRLRGTVMNATVNGSVVRVLDVINSNIIIAESSRNSSEPFTAEPIDITAGDLRRVSTGVPIDNNELFTDIYAWSIYYKRLSIAQCRPIVVIELSPVVRRLISLYEISEQRCVRDSECIFKYQHDLGSAPIIVNGTCRFDARCVWPQSLSPLDEARYIVWNSSVPTSSTSIETLYVSTKTSVTCDDACPTIILGPVVAETVCDCPRRLDTVLVPALRHYLIRKTGSLTTSTCSVCDGASCRRTPDCYNSCIINGARVLSGENVCYSYSFSCGAILSGVCVIPDIVNGTLESVKVIRGPMWKTVTSHTVSATIAPSSFGSFVARSGHIIPTLFDSPQFINDALVYSRHSGVEWRALITAALTMNATTSNERWKRRLVFAMAYNKPGAIMVEYGIIYANTSETLFENISITSTVDIVVNFDAIRRSFIITTVNDGVVTVCEDTTCTQRTISASSPGTTFPIIGPVCIEASTYEVTPNTTIILDRPYIILSNFTVTNEIVVITDATHLQVTNGCITFENTVFDVSNVSRSVLLEIAKYNGCIVRDNISTIGLSSCEVVSWNDGNSPGRNASALVSLTLLVDDNGCRRTVKVSIYLIVGGVVGFVVIVIAIILIIVYLRHRKTRNIIAPFHDRRHYVADPSPTTPRHIQPRAYGSRANIVSATI